MIKVEFFGSYRLAFKTSQMELEVNTIGEMLRAISSKFEAIDIKEITNATIFVNDRILQGIFRNRHKLSDGDKVLMMYPSCGG